MSSIEHVPGIPRVGTARAHPATPDSLAHDWGKRFVWLVLLIWGAGLVAGFRNALLLLAVVGFFAALLGILRPTIGMFGIAILCTIDSVARAYLLTGGLWRWNTFNYLLLFVIFLGLPFLLRLHDPQTRLLQAFVLLLAVGLAFSVERPSGVQQILNIVTVFGLLRYLAVGTRGREIWHWMAMVSGAVAGAGGFVFYLQVGGLPEINPNAWSLFPLTALFLITLGVFAAAGRKRVPMILPLLAALNATWVFLSGSRGSMLIALVCVAFILFHFRKSGRAIPIIGFAVLIVMGIGSQFLQQNTVALHRIDKLLDTRRPLASRTSGRSDLALAGWRMFLANPVLGVGTGGFGHAWLNLKNRDGMSTFREGDYAQAHSGWIKVLAENGTPGALLFSAFVASFVVLGWRRRREGVFLLGLLATLALSVAFLAEEFQAKGLWLLAAAAMTLLRRSTAIHASAHPSLFPRLSPQGRVAEPGVRPVAHEMRARGATPAPGFPDSGL